MARSRRGSRGARASRRLSGMGKKEAKNSEEQIAASQNEDEIAIKSSSDQHSEEDRDARREGDSAIVGDGQKSADLPAESSRSEARQQAAGNSYEQLRAAKMAQTASLLRLLDLPVPVVTTNPEEGLKSSDKESEEGGEEGSEPGDGEEEGDDKGDDDYDPGFEAFTHIDEDEEEEEEEDEEEGEQEAGEGGDAGKRSGGSKKRRLKKGKRESGKLGFDSQQDWEYPKGRFDAPSMEEMAMSARGDMDEDELALQQAIRLSLQEANDLAPRQHSSQTQQPSEVAVREECEGRGKEGEGGSSKAARPNKRVAQNGSRQPNRHKKQQRQPGFSPLSCSDADHLYLLFDCEGRGHLTASDVARVASAHSFAWSDEMMDDMVTLFSSSSSAASQTKHPSSGSRGMAMSDFHRLLHQLRMTQQSLTADT